MPVPSDGIAALVLAAGAGSRLGGDKLLLPWRGKPLLLHVIEAAAVCVEKIVVVAGCRPTMIRETVERHAASLPASIVVVENSRWQQGQSTSLQCGMESILTSGIQGILVMLGDQPLVRPDTLALLVEAHLSDPPPLATVPVHDGHRGNPVILSPGLAPAIAALRGDVGARHILTKLGDGMRRVPVTDPGVLRDIDTPDDYRDLTS